SSALVTVSCLSASAGEYHPQANPGISSFVNLPSLFLSSRSKIESTLGGAPKRPRRPDRGPPAGGAAVLSALGVSALGTSALGVSVFGDSALPWTLTRCARI